MQSLINDLLAFARVGAGIQRGLVDLTVVFKEVRDDVFPHRPAPLWSWGT